MPAAAGLVSSPSKSALRELAAILSRILRRSEDGLLAALVLLAGDPVLDSALVRGLLILFAYEIILLLLLWETISIL